MADRNLTAKQQAFVLEYLVDRNATQAAIRAGYSPKTARQIGEENLSKPDIRAAVDEGLKRLAEKTETAAEWVRRRLREEATNFSKDASHSARVRAIELIAKLDGLFELDNRQRTDPVTELLQQLGGRTLGVSPEGE